MSLSASQFVGILITNFFSLLQPYLLDVSEGKQRIRSIKDCTNRKTVGGNKPKTWHLGSERISQGQNLDIINILEVCIVLTGKIWPEVEMVRLYLLLSSVYSKNLRITEKLWIKNQQAEIGKLKPQYIRTTTAWHMKKALISKY